MFAPPLSSVLPDLVPFSKFAFFRFATVEVMRQYGQLLENFYSNVEAVNDCIFTMMHHVCGDLNTPETLFIPQVLETFSDIWERVSKSTIYAYLVFIQYEYCL